MYLNGKKVNDRIYYDGFCFDKVETGLKVRLNTTDAVVRPVSINDHENEFYYASPNELNYEYTVINSFYYGTNKDPDNLVYVIKGKFYGTYGMIKTSRGEDDEDIYGVVFARYTSTVGGVTNPTIYFTFYDTEVA